MGNLEGKLVQANIFWLAAPLMFTVSGHVLAEDNRIPEDGFTWPGA